MKVKIPYFSIRYKWLWFVMFTLGAFVFIMSGSATLVFFREHGSFMYENKIAPFVPALLGVNFMFWAIHILHYTRYFIEVDDECITWFYKGMKQPESIAFVDVHKVDVKLMEVVFYHESGTRTLRLDNLDYRNLKRIKEKISGNIALLF